MQEAAKKMRYFEVFDGSGKWSYSLGYGEKVSPKLYDSISEEIVFVTNVPKGISSLEVDGIFSQYGEIKFCHVRIDKYHNSIGQALVIYKDPKSVVKAIQDRKGKDVLKANAYKSK